MRLFVYHVPSGTRDSALEAWVGSFMFQKINIELHVLSCSSMFVHLRQHPASSLLQFLSFKLRGAL